MQAKFYLVDNSISLVLIRSPIYNKESRKASKNEKDIFSFIRFIIKIRVHVKRI